MIDDLVRKEGSFREVAKTIGIDHAHLTRIVKPGSNPELKTVEKLLSHFGFSLSVEKIEKPKSKAQTPKRRRIKK